MLPSEAKTPLARCSSAWLETRRPSRARARMSPAPSRPNHEHLKCAPPIAPLRKLIRWPSSLAHRVGNVSYVGASASRCAQAPHAAPCWRCPNRATRSYRRPTRPHLHSRYWYTSEGRAARALDSPLMARFRHHPRRPAPVARLQRAAQLRRSPRTAGALMWSRSCSRPSAVRGSLEQSSQQDVELERHHDQARERTSIPIHPPPILPRSV